MPHPQVTLDVAAFLDSPRAKALDGPKPDEVRKIVGAWLSVCYDDLGKKPKFLDGHDLHTALGHLLPGRLKRKDPLAAHVPAVLEAWLEYLFETEVVTQSFELKNALATTMQEFQETVRTGENPHHHHERQAPFVHKADKLGRNDPCSCGSGKKYKKCHGKNA